MLLDDFNYLFSSSWQIGDIWPTNLKFSRWRKESSSSLVKGNLISQKFEKTKANKKVQYLERDKVSFEGQLPKWNYILDIKSQDHCISGPVILEIHGSIVNGKISCVILGDDYQTLISNEDKTEMPGEFTLSVQTEKWTNSAVIRTVSDDYFEFAISEIKIFEGVSTSSLQTSLSSKWHSKIRDFSSYTEFKNWLGITSVTPQFESQPVLHHNGWLMEQSSSWLIVEIAKSFTLPKILEIGTWEGYTASILLKNSDSLIWTIDRDKVIDTRVYPSRYEVLNSPDSREIGWLYKKLEYEGRVKQFISDSTLFDWSNFEDQMFKIIFIDGDHCESSVKSDSYNSYSKLVKSGICIWDDFNFDGFGVSEAELGVTNFVENNLEWLNARYELAFLHGTQFLIGKKR